MTISLKPFLFLALLLAAGCRYAANSGTTYPSPRPDTAALRFLPGIVSKDSLDFNAAFSPDGQTFYFCRSANGKWGIWQTENRNGRWSEPVPAPFSEPAYSQADPFFAQDGTLYFISNRPKTSEDVTGDYDIWRVRQLENGRWSAPQNVMGVNSDSTEYYVSLAANGNIYFASNRSGDFEIYYSRLENGRYGEPENLGPAINAPGMEHDPCISPDEKMLLFTAVNRPDTIGSADIYISLKNDVGQWNKAVNAGPKVNTTSYEYCSYLTPDGKYFFFSSEYDVKWIAAEQLGR
ncbi:PD40 domain-containing protein [Chitinophaga sp. GCM10012297]|uniref:PD40 domain-containing protein n=1 Tax=Chitinophaga chungangae TaxID=2821488 RepID=A0ABS3YH12_9BACT|nr:PD40 domain-containing protein [Chitinophaga chungangae]MBO9153975.1 PD40 domain-containing protein [Chitinophaga chungangae]